ncbi:hypothetical protein Tco_1509630 [Tanacetum coccineum]
MTMFPKSDPEGSTRRKDKRGGPICGGDRSIEIDESAADTTHHTIAYRGETSISIQLRHDSNSRVGYGITDSWDEIVETLQGAPVSTDTELGQHMTAFETRVRQQAADRKETGCDFRKMLKADQRRSAEIRGLRTADHTG